MHLGERVRQLRKARGLTQSQLGGQEFTKGFISLVEHGRAKPSVESLAVMTRRLGTSIDALLGGKEALPDQAVWALLGLSEKALQRNDLRAAGQLLEMVEGLIRLYPVPEADRELQVQEATLAIERRGFDQALQTLQAAQSNCARVNDYWRGGRIHVLTGIVRLRQREFRAAIDALHEGLQLLKRAHAGRDPVRIRALLALGSALLYQDEIPAAMRAYREAAASDVAQVHPILRGRALWGLGAAYRKQGAVEKALAALRQAADALEEAEELPDLARVLHNVGQVYLEDKAPNDAADYFRQALRIAEQLKLDSLRASTLTELARAYAELGKPADARKAAVQALSAARDVGDPVEIADSAVVLSQTYAQGRQPSRAVPLLQEALETYQRRGMKSKATETSQRLAQTLMIAGEKAQAAEYFALALTLAGPQRRS